MRKTERAFVPGQDMLVAHAYASVLSRYFRNLYWQFNSLRWPPLSREIARQLVAGTSDAARRFEVETRLVSPLNAQQANSNVLSLRGGYPAIWLQTASAARYTLEIAAGERSLDESIYPAIHDANAERAEFLATLIPVLGEYIIAYEFLSGTMLLTGRRLTEAEKIAAAIALILPNILAVIGRTAVSAFKISRNTITLILEDMKVYSLTRSLERIPRSVNIALGLRVLGDNYFKEFIDLLQRVRAAAKFDLFEFMKPQEISRLNFFVLRMKDSARTAAWLDIIERELGAGAKGYQKLKAGVKPKPREVAGLKLLAEKTGDPVFHLPETQPTLYPKQFQVQNATYPDAIWRKELVDIYSPVGSDANNLVRVIGRKQEQCPTVVVALLEDAKFTKADVEQILSREFWPNSEFVGVSKIVVVDQRGFYMFARPNNFVPPFMAGIIRLGIDDPDHLRSLYQDLLKEPDPQPH